MPNQVRACHILVKTEGEAVDILNQIRSGKDFGELAKTHSECPSGAKGGDLGFFRRGQMVREFENTAFSMNTGDVSEPVKTQFGYHLIKITDTK
jgi:peptidyl-prolyl cis-trans isomerase C